MKNCEKYSKQFFAPRGVTMDWVKKEYIDRYDVDEILKQNNIDVNQIIKDLL